MSTSAELSGAFRKTNVVTSGRSQRDFRLISLAMALPMVSMNVVRRLVPGAASFRRTQSIRPKAAIARISPQVRCMSSESPLAKDEGGSQLERRDENQLARDKNSPLRVFDLMDSFFPTRSLRSMIDSMDRIFEDPFFSPSAFRPETPLRRSMRVPWDFQETDKDYKLRFDMPGLSKEEVKVYVEDDDLVIKGEHEKKSEDDEWVSRSHGSYNCRIVLPDNANPEQIKAELKNGVLNVTIAKVVRQEQEKNVIDVPVE
ncbi:hypothetical protein R1flu_000275 [Riccia fluitans]|uniref:SHSP domain-containing protein n=1 Tax=Riccia fluitans TaxID=41844 RepID=A0ABD1XZZ9_9MARC